MVMYKASWLLAILATAAATATTLSSDASSAQILAQFKNKLSASALERLREARLHTKGESNLRSSPVTVSGSGNSMKYFATFTYSDPGCEGKPFSLLAMQAEKCMDYYAEGKPYSITFSCTSDDGYVGHIYDGQGCDDESYLGDEVFEEAYTFNSCDVDAISSLPFPTYSVAYCTNSIEPFEDSPILATYLNTDCSGAWFAGSFPRSTKCGALGDANSYTCTCDKHGVQVEVYDDSTCSTFAYSNTIETGACEIVESSIESAEDTSSYSACSVSDLPDSGVATPQAASWLAWASLMAASIYFAAV